MKTYGSYQAKTHWSELIQLVMDGETVRITLHGEHVADIRPPAKSAGPNYQDIKQRFRKLRKNKTMTPEDINSLIKESRKYA